MSSTVIQTIFNKTSDYLLFLDLENPGQNHFLSPGQEKKVDCLVPWSSSHEEFLKKGIVVINRFKKTTLGYIWQDHDSNKDDRVRLWYTGWDKPTLENRMPGYSIVGGKINLIINSEGKISAEQAS